MDFLPVLHALAQASGLQMGSEMSRSSLTPSESPSWEGVRISVEHGWLCIRQERGWLLWNAKLADMPSHGLLLEDVLLLAQAAKAKDDKEMEAYLKEDFSER